MIDLLKAYKTQCCFSVSKKARLLFWGKILIIFLGILLVFFNLQYYATKVAAQNLPLAVSTNHLAFGLVFPGEIRDGEFIVYSSPEYSQPVKYKIVQKRKPLPEGYLGEADPDLPGYYRNLCPFLEKINSEGEGDAESSAYITPPTDPSDRWIVRLYVPAIQGYVAQTHGERIVSTAGEYGCDISVDIIEEVSSGGVGGGPESPPNLDLAVPAEFRTPKVEGISLQTPTVPPPLPKTISSVIKKVILPTKLPRVGAWSVLILASVGLIWEIIAYQKRKR